MTNLDRMLSDVCFVTELPKGLSIVIARVDRLDVESNETMKELRRALEIAYTAALRLQCEAVAGASE